MFTRFLFSGPARAGLLHADPHPGNFRMLADGRLACSTSARWTGCPTACPRSSASCSAIIHEDGDIREAEDELREQGFVRPGIDVDLDALYAFLAPLAEPSRQDTFKFSREWLRSEAARVTDPRSSNLGRRLNLPPSYVLIHRVSTEGIGVLCQLGSEGPFRAELIRWMPGYAVNGTRLPAGQRPPPEPATAGGRLDPGPRDVPDPGPSGRARPRPQDVLDPGPGDVLDPAPGTCWTPARALCRTLARGPGPRDPQSSPGDLAPR